MDPNGEALSSSRTKLTTTRKLPAWAASSASSSDQQAPELLKAKAHKRGPEIDADGGNEEEEEEQEDDDDDGGKQHAEHRSPLTKTMRKSSSRVLGKGDTGETKQKPKNNIVTNTQPGSKPPAVPLQDFSKLLEGVVFAISGVINPERGYLREQAIDMGARYKPDWTSDCTLLVCAFPNTPKFKQVTADGGTIVSKDWIPECHRRRKLIDIDRYLMNVGRPWRRQSSLTRAVQTANVDDRTSAKEMSCGSYEDIQQWAHDDLMSSISWLQQQEVKPKPEELEGIAAEGILICLEDTIKGLQETSGVATIVKDWGFVPRAVKELAALEECKGGGKHNIAKEAERLHGIYVEELRNLSACGGASEQADKKKEIEKEEREAVEKEEDEDVDDDATEVMSDEDWQEAVEQDHKGP